MTMRQSDEFLRLRLLPHAVRPPTDLPFITDFAGVDESPISDGGVWGKAPNAWIGYKRAGGIAKPIDFTDDANPDAYTMLQRDLPDNIEVIATAYRNGSTDSGERTLLLRAVETPTQLRAYSFWYHSFSGACGIGKWDGPVGEFSEISTFQDQTHGALADGDQFRAVANGSALSWYWRRPPTEAWTLIASATNADFAGGRVAISSFLRSGNGALADVGWRSIEVNAL